MEQQKNICADTPNGHVQMDAHILWRTTLNHRTHRLLHHFAILDVVARRAALHVLQTAAISSNINHKFFLQVLNHRRFSIHLLRDRLL